MRAGLATLTQSWKLQYQKTGRLDAQGVGKRCLVHGESIVAMPGPLSCSAGMTVQALGIKPKTVRAPKQPTLDQRDMAQLMQRGEDEEEEDPARQAERIKGLGFRV